MVLIDHPNRFVSDFFGVTLSFLLFHNGSIFSNLEPPVKSGRFNIINLEISDIDWRASAISVMQQKTSDPVTVPMEPGLAKALGRYLLEGRPPSDSPKVFVRQKAPHVPLVDHAAIYAATRRTLSSAGVAGGGTRLLRHNAASRMLRAGAQLPVIASVLGHVSSDSTNVYMEADEDSMAACVLPLPRGCA